MSDNATHDPKKYVVRVAGYRVTGFANGTGFNSTMAQPRAEVVVGNNGLAAYSITHSNAATITLTLMPGSDANDVFASILTADALAGRLVPLWVTQENGRVAEGGFGRFVQQPDLDVADTISPRVWTFISANYKKFIGGQDATPIANTVDDINAIIAAASPIEAAT